MVTLALQRQADGAWRFTGTVADGDGQAPRPLAPEVLVETVRSVVWYPDAVQVERAGVSVSHRNLLMFLSDVRTRRFRRGLFVDDSVLAAAQAFRTAADGVAHGWVLPDVEKRPDGFHAVWRPLGAADAFFTDALMRRAGWTVLETSGKFFTVHDAWLGALRAEESRINWSIMEDVEALARHLADWRAPLAVPRAERAQLMFRLEPPDGTSPSWRIVCRPPVSRAGLMALGQAAALFPPLASLRGKVAVLTEGDAERFVHGGGAELAAAGFGVAYPPGLTDENVTVEAELFASGPKPAASAMPDASATVRLHVRIAGHEVGADEIRFLLDQKSPFVYFHEHWIEIDRFRLKDALKALEAMEGRKLTTHEAVLFSLGTQRMGRLRIAAVKAHGWLRGLLNEMRGEERFKVLPQPAELKAQLRDYQLRGASWLAFLVKWGFGALLADDMGLGKTVQTIAWMLRFRAEAPVRPRVLVVAPVSVTTNWVREIARFAPSLAVYHHQGAERHVGDGLVRAAQAADVTVTGYSLLVKDYRDLASAHFSALVLDEAQLVKNPETRMARAARGLNVPARIALTGTPLENSAADLWALEEFLNPGLLGSRTDFAAEYVRPIRDDAHAAAVRRLRHVLEPFLLRRLKTDPGVAAELGAKREIRTYCPLTLEQRRAYEEALAAYRADCAAEGEQGRNGRVLALLTALKLVCDGEGKLARLEELLEEIFAAGESVLVFTQYARVGRLIRTRLAEAFGRTFPFLHGGLAAEQREAEIAAFNADPEPNAFILSLRAGGFGLNLTRATHVIHFDRWWNPAVENQATDRAHRIGQAKTVFVHLFISPGTLEDHIDELLETKRHLAGEVITSGESFLLKMSPEALDRVVDLEAAVDCGGARH